jgi:hypothetical protein
MALLLQQFTRRWHAGQPPGFPGGRVLRRASNTSCAITQTAPASGVEANAVLKPEEER